MPTSTYIHTSDVMEVVTRLKPASVLDVGCGFGKWGLLFRDVCDVLRGRPLKEQWKTTIDAVEPFSEYIGEHHWSVYNGIWETTVQEWLGPNYPEWSYDVIWAGDVLEHLLPNEVHGVYLDLVKRSKVAFIAAVPVGEDWSQGASNGNELERHRNIWTRKKVIAYSDDRKFYTCMQGRTYAVFMKLTGEKKVEFPKGK